MDPLSSMLKLCGCILLVFSGERTWKYPQDVYSRLQKSCSKVSWTKENHNWFIVLEQRGRACWGGKDNQIRYS